MSCPCTLSPCSFPPLRSPMLTLFHPCAPSPSHPCTLLPLYPFTLSFHLCTIVPSHPCTLSSLCSPAPAPSCPCVFSSSCSPTLSNLHPHALTTLKAKLQITCLTPHAFALLLHALTNSGI